LICAVCGQFRDDLVCFSVAASSHEHQGNANAGHELDWEILRITDDFIIRECIMSMLSNEFLFNNPSLDGLMLDKQGVHCQVLNDYDNVQICSNCHSSIEHGRILCLFLANNLYHGQLPDEFKDLT
jgi:hypothetical protein